MYLKYLLRITPFKNYDIYWKMQLYLGDCLELMKDIPDSSVDFVLTDPPYGTTACKWDTVIPFDLMWKHLQRIIKPNVVVCLFGSEPYASALRMSNPKMFKYDWVWIKTKASNFQLARKMPMKRHETVSVFGGSKYFLELRDLDKPIKSSRGNKGANLHGSRIIDSGSYFQKQTGYKFSDLHFSNPSGKGHFHPTQKPVPLLEYLIKTYTLENETVLDFTMGSGSTGVAARNLNRNFIGIEKDPEYFEIAKKRIESVELLNTKNYTTV